MGCDSIQPPDYDYDYDYDYARLVLLGKPLDLIKSDLQYQGYLSKSQAETISDEELLQLARNHEARLHLHKNYNYVEYYQLVDMSRDACQKLLNFKDLEALEELTHTEIEVWRPACRQFWYGHSLCIKGFTQDSVNKVLEELRRIKETALHPSEEPEESIEPLWYYPLYPRHGPSRPACS